MSCHFREDVTVLSKCWTGRTVLMKVAVDFDSEVTSKLHYRAVERDKQI